MVAIVAIIANGTSQRIRRAGKCASESRKIVRITVVVPADVPREMICANRNC